ncbi:ras guanine nucleotide exchange factor domain-containing protein [Infundibulicybe gibba]|nr:ras guanine nucleotide exchange factor domain-containing protein [Infundibulicybe gibba]
MSIKDLVALSGVPGLDLGVSILTASYATIQNIKVYRQQCGDLSTRCVNLMLSFRDGTAGLEGSKAAELADEVTFIIQRIDRKVSEWASYSRLKSFLQIGEIKDGIDRLHRDIDAAMMKFNVSINMELARGHLESKAIQERDKAEIRELLQGILKSNEDMKALLNMKSSQPVEDVMESLQTELQDPELRPVEKQTYRDGLWLLHQKTDKLPPLTNLTGQITLRSEQVEAVGTFNEVYMGDWLDREPVALRLPRTILNDVDAQRRFQREVAIWRNLKHFNVVPLYGIVSPWMDNGTAITYVRGHPQADRLRILSEAASGLEYLHLQGIVHGDLRGSNVLISKDGRARLSDFGLSKLLEDCGQGMTSSPGVNPRWFAPELLRQNGPVSTHSDVWSFAMVCLELMTGDQPFHGVSGTSPCYGKLIRVRYLIDQVVGYLARLTDELWALMKRCWNKKPEMRPSMTEIKSKLAEIRGISSQSDSSLPKSTKRTRFLITSARRRPGATVVSRAPIDRIKIPFMNNASQIVEEPIGVSPIHIHPRQAGALPTAADPNVGERHLRQNSISEGHSTLSDASHNMSAPLREAVSNPSPIVHCNKVTGAVLAGTLEGLVERLIVTFNQRKEAEYRDILFTGCTDFTTSEDLFGILAGDRVGIQYDIFMVIMYWLSSGHLQVDPQLLWQMKNFCLTAMSMKSSQTMNNKAWDLLELIEDRSNRDPSSPLALSPGRKIPRASDILPRDLAIALALLEGDKYRAILPTDYIAHLKRYPGINGVEVACQTNNKIILWVKQSVLHYDEIDSRVQVLKFFINAALECRKMRNFSSLTAIAMALHSAPIERLGMSRKELPQGYKQVLDELEDLLDPTSGHRAYKAALAQSVDPEYHDSCIPWLPVHLRELHLTLQRYPPVMDVDGQPLINFERYVKFTDRVREVLHHVPPDLEPFRQRGQLAYLEHQLRELGECDDEEMMERSVALEAGEARDYRSRRRELQKLGFRTKVTSPRTRGVVADGASQFSRA